MPRWVIATALVWASMATPASATPEILTKANQGRAAHEQFECTSCHSVMPSRFHKYHARDLTEEGQKWHPPKRSWWQKLFSR